MIFRIKSRLVSLGFLDHSHHGTSSLPHLSHLFFHGDPRPCAPRNLTPTCPPDTSHTCFLPAESAGRVGQPLPPCAQGPSSHAPGPSPSFRTLCTSCMAAVWALYLRSSGRFLIFPVEDKFLDNKGSVFLVYPHWAWHRACAREASSPGGFPKLRAVVRSYPQHCSRPLSTSGRRGAPL